MTHRYLLAVLGAASAFAVQATTVPLPADDEWHAFTVDPLLAADHGFEWIESQHGSPLSFEFTVAAGTVATLTVIDGGYGGDSFSVSVNGLALPNTSKGGNSYPKTVGSNFDAAYGNKQYSRGYYSFVVPGQYTVTGALFKSAQDDHGVPLNNTVGAVLLEVSAVPELSTLSSLLAGLGLLALVSRRPAAASF